MRFLYLLLLCPFLLSAQLKKPLTVGDYFHYEDWRKINASSHNSPLEPVPLKREDGGIILDFFATWCTGCVKALPHLDSLQKEFGNPLQLFVITAEPQDKIEAFRKKNKIFADCQLSIVSGDTILHKLFPHILIPHEVWIGADGIVKAITGGEEVTAANVSDMLAGKPLNLPLKKDILDFDYHKPLLQDGNGGDAKNILTHSLLTAKLEGMTSMEGMVWSDDSTVKRFFYINRPLYVLYSIAGRQMKIKNETLYSYELTVPSYMPMKAIQRWILQDLDRYFISTDKPKNQ